MWFTDFVLLAPRLSIVALRRASLKHGGGLMFGTATPSAKARGPDAVLPRARLAHITVAGHHQTLLKPALTAAHVRQRAHAPLPHVQHMSVTGHVERVALPIFQHAGSDLSAISGARGIDHVRRRKHRAVAGAVPPLRDVSVIARRVLRILNATIDAVLHRLKRA